MAHQFRKHYTRAEARKLLPDIRRWLRRLGTLRSELQKQEAQVTRLLAPGRDVGGRAVNAWVRTLADMKSLLLEFYCREIQIKDVERGLIDFPAILDGKEVFLCWEQGEDDIQFWHDLYAGYAGRERLDDEKDK